MQRLATVFKLDYSALNTSLALLVLELILILSAVFVTNHYASYILSAIFGALFAGLDDPGGTLKLRLKSMALMGMSGALLTALGFGLGATSWGWITIVAFTLTLLSGLSLKYGAHLFAAALLLNLWFVITLGVSNSYSQNHITINAWGQALAWLGGTVFWFSAALLLWLIRGSTVQALVTQIPADTSRRQLTKPVVAFAVIRALALAVAVAIPFGFNLAHGQWLPIATLIAMKADLAQTTVSSLQRLIGTLIGAALASFLLWAISNKLELIAAALTLLANGTAIRFVNFAWYNAAIAAGVLVALDIFHPSNLTTEWNRVWYTLVGVGIGVAVMFAADRMGRRRAKL